MEIHRDRAVEEMIRQRLMEDNRVSGQSISVVSSRGYVQITGIVESEDARIVVLQLIAGVMGVRNVEDRMVLRSREAA